MRRSLPALLGVLLLLGPGLAGTLNQVRAAGVLRVGTDATYPPFESKTEAGFEGFDIDLVERLARDLGVRVAWVNTAFDGIFPALLAGKFDLVASSVTITPERTAQMRFTRPYYNAGQLIAVARGGPSFETLTALSGHTVGVQINTTGQFVLEKQGGVSIRKYNSIDLALLDLRARRLDAVLSDAPTVRYMIRKGFPELTTVGKPLTEEFYGLAMRPDDTDLQAALDQSLEKLDTDGGYAALHRKWFGEPAFLPQLATAKPREEAAKAPGAGEVLRPLLRGLRVSLELTLLALLAGLPLGLLVSLVRMSSFRPVAWLAGFYIELMRGTPLLVQIFAIYYVLPAIGVRLPALPSALVALSLNVAAYIAEILRAGVQSIDVGQMEAARSLGLSYGLAMRLVVLPQAFRRVVPPLTNEAIALLKDTSLVSVVAISELTRSGSELASRLGRPTLVWPLVAALYLLLTFPLSRLSARLERRWDVEGRQP
ncbi:MAG: ABC transporter permease subunit [Armatimonadetes bacterium]|nr:ABC transporter permease subunit [Armatimonadota bacterium]